MQEKSKTRTVTLCGEVYVEVIVGDGADGETEIQNVHSVSMMIGKPGCSIHLDLTRHKNSGGASIGVVILFNSLDKLLTLIAEQDKAEAQQAEQDKFDEPTI